MGAPLSKLCRPGNIGRLFHFYICYTIGMNFFERIERYYSHNPEGYWFKRKIFGWGWVPVAWQGWLVTIGYVGLILALVFSREESIPGNPDSGSNVLTFALPIVVLTTLLIFIAYKKGEKPRWQWGFPPEDERDDT